MNAAGDSRHGVAILCQQSQDSRRRQTVAFKGHEHLAFIKTSFNYDVDELCDSYLAEKWQTRNHLPQVIENKSGGHRCVSLLRVIHRRIFNSSSSNGKVSEQIVVCLERPPSGQ